MRAAVFLLILLLQCHGGLVAAQRPKAISSSGLTFSDLLGTREKHHLRSLPDAILWCDVQLSKDGVGVCLPTVFINNCSDIASVHPNNNDVYLVNGFSTSGLFSVDFTSMELAGFACRFCTKLGDDAMQPVQVGGLMQLSATEAQPPAEAPSPMLDASYVVDASQPSVMQRAPPTAGDGHETPPTATNFCISDRCDGRGLVFRDRMIRASANQNGIGASFLYRFMVSTVTLCSPFRMSNFEGMMSCCNSWQAPERLGISVAFLGQVLKNIDRTVTI